MKQLAYIQQGKGKAIILLHGFCESKEIWKGFIPVLAQNYSVIAIDLGGFGESADLLPNPCSIETMAEQVIGLLKAIQITKAVWVGHSMGGYVALAAAENYPQMIEKLCLFHSTALADSPEKKENRNKVIEFVQKAGVEIFIDSFFKNLIYQDRLNELQEKIQFVEEIGKKTPLKSVVALLEAMRDRKSRLEILQKALFPVLYIIGKQDSAVTWQSYEEQLKLLPHAQILVLEQTGHLGMLERPHETLQTLKQFIEGK